MAADASSPPSIQRTNYTRQLRAAEEVVAGVMDTILTEGGHILWHKYLERKAFHFAAETMTEAVASHLRSCFVAHDDGEDDLEDGWTLEEEPVPGEIDSWARMHVALRRPPKRGQGESDGGTGRGGTGRQPVPKRAARASDVRGKGAGRGRGGNPTDSKDGGKSFAIEEEFVIDPEEEAFRDQKRQEESARRDNENKARQNERDLEEIRRNQAQQHEEMDKRAHTFDLDGSILWVNEVKTDGLPKVQEIFGWAEGRKDPRSANLDSMGAAGKSADKSSTSASANNKKDRRRRNERSSQRDEKEPEFTDGFSKLQQCQPPIHETMTVKPGVVLESAGKTKNGPPPQNPNRQMSRSEYIQYVEAQVGGASTDGPVPGEQTQAPAQSGGDGTKGSGGDGAKAPGETQPPPSRQAGGRVSGSRETGAEAEGSRSAADLPGLNPGRGPSPTPSGAKGRAVAGVSGAAPSPPPAGHGGDGTPSGSRGGKLQRAPPAPDPKHRMKKHEAVGHLAFSKPPRHHVAPLGHGPHTDRSGPQPPLGATMGHGLVRSGSLKEAFYFPDPSKLPPVPLGRSASESMLPKKGGTPTSVGKPPPGGSRGFGAHADPEWTAAAKEEATFKKMGKIVPEAKSQAYREMRARFNASGAG